jgi:hypothetical protein
VCSFGHDEGTGAGGVVQGKRFPDLDDGVLGLTVIIGAGVEFGVHGKEVGGHVQEQGIGFFGFDVDGIVIDDEAAFEGLEKTFEISLFFMRSKVTI